MKLGWQMKSHHSTGVHSLRVLLLFIAATFLATPCLQGQTSTGSLIGRVTDPTQAVVPDAAVSVVNTSTNEKLEVRSDERGLYALGALQPGTYAITVSKKGFSEVHVSGVEVNIASSSTVDVQLKVGASNESVEVTATAQLINADNPVFSTEIPKEVTANLPFSERSALSAIMLAPGVQGDPQYNQGIQSENAPIYTQPTTPGGSLSVGGGRPGSAVQLVDGVDLSMVGYPRVAITFSGDDIQQVTVQSAGVSARYGRAGGGVVNQASKGGALQYHGKLAFRHEDPFFEATTYGQGNLTFTTPSGPLVRPVTQDVHQNLFTGTFSGPIPVRWHHLNQSTFFFGSFEPLRAGAKAWSQQRIPTPAELSGDFSNSYTLLNTSILSANGYAAAVAAPRVGGLDYQFPLNAAGFPNGAHLNSSTLYTPIPNYNLSAQLAQNPLAKWLLSQFPTPTDMKGMQGTLNFIFPDGSYNNNGNNIFGARGVQNVDNRYNIRVDKNLGTSDHAFVRFTDVPTTGTRFSWMGPTSVLDNQPTQEVDSWNILGDYTHIFGGKWVNDVRVDFTKMNYTVKPAAVTTGADYGAKYGLTPAVEGVGVPSFAIDTGTYGSSTGGNDGGISNNFIFHVGDDVSFVKGSHAISFGGEFRELGLNRLNNAGIFGGSYSFAAGNTNNGTTGGNGTASFILGSVNGLTLSALQFFDYRWQYAALYIMDDWKILPKLTLNIGLRYHLDVPRTEVNGLQGSFVPNLTGSLNGQTATGAFAFSGTNGLPKTLWPTNWKAFEPRIGFAYLVRPNLTVRGSFNIIHAPITGTTNSTIPGLTPSSLTIGGATGGTNSASWVNYITNPVSLPTSGIPGFLKPPTPFFTYGTGLLPYIPQTSVLPYVENWSFSMQYQVARQTVVQAAYVGSRSHHLFGPPQDSNILPLSTIYSEIASNYNFTDASVPNKYGVGSNANANNNLLPYPQFYNNTIQQAFVRENSSSYDAIYLNGTTTVPGGLTLISSFTWAKSLDDGSSGSLDGITTDIFGFTYPQKPFTTVGERALSQYDIPTHTSVGYTWAVPIGRGKALDLHNSVLNLLAGGLNTSGFFTAESGFPFSPTLGSAGYFCSNSATKYCGNGNAIAIGAGHYQMRPNLVPGVPLYRSNWRKNDPLNLTGSGGFINPNAFAVPGSPGTNFGPNTPAFGNAPRTLGNARSPHTIFFDMSGSKDFPIHERMNLQLHVDAINIFNHTDFFINPNSNHNFTTAINSTTGAPTYNTSFGALSAGNVNPGRTFAVGAAFTF